MEREQTSSLITTRKAQIQGQIQELQANSHRTKTLQKATGPPPLLPTWHVTKPPSSGQERRIFFLEKSQEYIQRRVNHHTISTFTFIVSLFVTAKLWNHEVPNSW